MGGHRPPLQKCLFRNPHHVSLVFETDEFHQFRVGQQCDLNIRAPRPGIGFGIVDRDLNIHVTEVFPLEACSHMQRLG